MKFARIYPETVYAVQLTSRPGEGAWYLSTTGERTPLGPHAQLYYSLGAAVDASCDCCGRAVRIILTPEVVA